MYSPKAVSVFSGMGAFIMNGGTGGALRASARVLRAAGGDD
jgi:hypothetical protein